jgi:hypothetical protein
MFTPEQQEPHTFTPEQQQRQQKQSYTLTPENQQQQHPPPQRWNSTQKHVTNNNKTKHTTKISHINVNIYDKTATSQLNSD